jgi:hypothetical protein
MFAKTVRPQRTDLTIEEKLSSRITMSAASFATSVPAMPIARPTSATCGRGQGCLWVGSGW